jgi:hypothetical protein
VDKWREGSLYDHIDQFANSLGYENAAIAVSLAMIPWESIEERNSFIQAITGDSPKGNDGRNYVSGIQRG